MLGSQLPCHFYHISKCMYPRCQYSHQGKPAGTCINPMCKVCEKDSQLNYFQNQLMSTNNLQGNQDQFSLMQIDYNSFYQSANIPNEYQNQRISPNSQQNSKYYYQNALKQGQENYDYQHKQNLNLKNDDWSSIQCEQMIALIQSYNKQNNFQMNPGMIIQNQRKLMKEFNADCERELDFLFVIDFECTCNQEQTLQLQEIIEFPIIVVDVKKRQITNTFHSFVRPTINTELTEFCTNLTGITQKQVSKASTLDLVLKAIQFFMQPYLHGNSAVVNDCEWDMKHFLLKESEFKGIRLPDYFKNYINLSKVFPVQENEGNEIRPKYIESMLKCLNLEFQGRRHSGIADAKNIAKVALELIRRGYKFTTSLKESIFKNINKINQKFKNLIVLDIETAKNNNDEKYVTEIAAVVLNLHRNSIKWNNILHYKIKEKNQEDNFEINKNEQSQYHNLKQIINKLDEMIKQYSTSKMKSVIAIFGKSGLNSLQLDLQREQLEVPEYLNNYLDLNKLFYTIQNIPFQRKNIKHHQQIEQWMQKFQLPITINDDFNPSCLVSALNLTQIAKSLVQNNFIFTEDFISYTKTQQSNQIN